MHCFLFDWISADTYKSVVAPTLAPLFVVLGWLVVSRDNDRRETRKEVRAVLNDLCKQLDALEALAVEYYSDVDNAKNLARARELEFKIKRDLERISGTIQHLGRIYPGFGCTDEFLELANSITGHKKFESREPPEPAMDAERVWEPAPPDDAVYAYISLACIQLTREWDAAFYTHAQARSLLQSMVATGPESGS